MIDTDEYHRRERRRAILREEGLRWLIILQSKLFTYAHYGASLQQLVLAPENLLTRSMEYAAEDEKEEKEKEKKKKKKKKKKKTKTEKQNLQRSESARVSMSNVRKLVQS
jgi:hypothetical protein